MHSEKFKATTVYDIFAWYKDEKFYDIWNIKLFITCHLINLCSTIKIWIKISYNKYVSCMFIPYLKFQYFLAVIIFLCPNIYNIILI